MSNDYASRWGCILGALGFGIYLIWALVRNKKSASIAPAPQKIEYTIEELKKLSFEKYYHTEHWKKLHAEIVQRDNYTCQKCGKQYLTHISFLNVHHLTYERRGEELLEDLITLCYKCHAHVHGKDPQLFIPRKFRRYPKSDDELGPLIVTCPNGHEIGELHRDQRTETFIKVDEIKNMKQEQSLSDSEENYRCKICGSIWSSYGQVYTKMLHWIGDSFK